jgi:prophage DNA circulation protein
VQLTAPDGTTFKPKWRGDKITGTKKVAQFTYPGTDGTIVQDLGLTGLSFPMILYFDDDPGNTAGDNDIQAWSFLQALAQKGKDGRAIWSVVHPVYGTRKLQPISFELDANPTESGGVSVVTTQWVEPVINPTGAPDAAAQASAWTYTAAASSASQLSANADQTTLDKVAALANSVKTGIGSAKGYLNQANQAVQTIESNINAALQVVPIALIDMAAQVKNLFSAPGAIIGDINQQVGLIGGMLGALFSSSPTPTTTGAGDRNAVAATEMIACAQIIGMCNSILAGTLTTRAQAVQAIVDLNTWLAYMRDALDARQTAFAAVRADLQYFSQSQGYADLMLLVSLTQKYLQGALFNLKATKVYTLQSGRSTLEIAMSEYGVPGQTWDDGLYDLFIATNNLHGNDILWLPAGRKVTVYL